MDTKSSPTRALTLLLAALCVAVTAAGITWQAWDMFGPKNRPMLQGWDDSFYYFWLPSAVIDGDLDFTNQLKQTTSIHAGARDDALSTPRTDAGYVSNKYPPGWAFGSLPFFLLAHAFSAQGATGFEPGYLICVWIGQLLYAIVGAWAARKIVAHYFPGYGSIATLAVWLASPLVYYQTARLSMSHSQVFVLAALTFWTALRIRGGANHARDWAFLGFCAALLVATRNVAAIYLAMPAVVVAPQLRKLANLGWALAGAILPIAVQLTAWRILFGSWVVYTYGGERFNFGDLHLIEVLFSPRHGWFYWHPLTLPAIAAFCVWAIRNAEGRAWLVSLALIILLNAAWPTWWLGSSFGYRGFEVATLFAMIGFASLLHITANKSWWRGVVVGAAVAAIAWNLLLFALFLTQRIPRQEPVTYADAAHAAIRWFAALF